MRMNFDLTLLMRAFGLGNWRPWLVAAAASLAVMIALYLAFQAVAGLWPVYRARFVQGVARHLQRAHIYVDASRLLTLNVVVALLMTTGALVASSSVVVGAGGASLRLVAAAFYGGCAAVADRCASSPTYHAALRWLARGMSLNQAMAQSPPVRRRFARSSN
jgi:hypothetical protein